MYVACTAYVHRWYIWAMGTKKERKNYRIFRHYLDRLEVLLAPHETETDFVESALHREILRREEEAKRESRQAA